MVNEVARSFAEQLRRYRTGAGLSQEELAERAGLTAAAVSQLERGVRHRPQPRTVRALADALDLAGDERTALLAAGRGPEPQAADADALSTAREPTAATSAAPS